jgi:hypothetical protein
MRGGTLRVPHVFANVPKLGVATGIQCAFEDALCWSCDDFSMPLG